MIQDQCLLLLNPSDCHLLIPSIPEEGGVTKLKYSLEILKSHEADVMVRVLQLGQYRSDVV